MRQPPVCQDRGKARPPTSSLRSADPRLWEEVDGALTEFTALLCPLDLRGALAQTSALRAELALPQRFGGLSIPIVREQAPIRAAEQWEYEDAKEMGVNADMLAGFQTGGGAGRRAPLQGAGH